VEYAYRRIGSRSFEDTLDAVERVVRDHGFEVLCRHDITAALVAKGFPIRPLVIFEIAPQKHDSEDPLSLLLPCRVNVYEEDAGVVVAALRPTLWSAVFPEHELDGIAEEFEKTVTEMVDAAVS